MPFCCSGQILSGEEFDIGVSAFLNRLDAALAQRMDLRVSGRLCRTHLRGSKHRQCK
jgi:hypothetical protein